MCAASPLSDSDGPLCILIAEDDAPSLELAMFVLRSRGHQVTAVGNGRDALDLLAEGSYDVVLLDVHMPVMDGVEAVRELRRTQQDGPRQRVIALTAHAVPEEQERLMKLGFDQVIAKPLRFDELFREIEGGSGG